MQYFLFPLTYIKYEYIQGPIKINGGNWFALDIPSYGLGEDKYSVLYHLQAIVPSLECATSSTLKPWGHQLQPTSMSLFVL